MGVLQTPVTTRMGSQTVITQRDLLTQVLERLLESKELYLDIPLQVVGTVPGDAHIFQLRALRIGPQTLRAELTLRLFEPTAEGN